MRCVIQRVAHASVDVSGETVGKIDNGFLVLIGAQEGDIALIGQDTTLPEGFKVLPGEQIDNEEIARREEEAK